MVHSETPLFDYINFGESGLLKTFTATIGFFDGLHLGHQYLLQQLRDLAKKRGEGSLVISFLQHPRQTLSHSVAPPLLMSRQQLPTLLQQSGIDCCALLHFSPEMANMTAQQFMKKILVEQFQVRTLLMGYDHHFGRRRQQEGFEQYQTYGQSLGLEVMRAEAFQLPEAQSGIAPKVASSSIRLLLQQGKVKEATLLLGRPYRIEGSVVKGRQNGRKIGFPTANLDLSPKEQLIPLMGVYATRAYIDGQAYSAMTNIGRRPTFDNGEDISIETHIFDLDQEFYGSSMQLEFIERLRDEQHFEGLEALIAQLDRDAQKARQVLSLL